MPSSAGTDTRHSEFCRYRSCLLLARTGQPFLHAANHFWPIPILSFGQETRQNGAGGKAVTHIYLPLSARVCVEPGALDALDLASHRPENIEYHLCYCFCPQIIGMACVNTLPLQEIVA